MGALRIILDVQSRIIIFISILLLGIPTPLFPTGEPLTVPYSLTDLIREERMSEYAAEKIRQAYHGRGYPVEILYTGEARFYRDGRWCRYVVPDGWIPPGWRMEG